MVNAMSTIALALLSSLAAATAAAPPTPLPLEWCLERGRQANPEIAVEAADADAARERVAPAGALEDPRFSYEASNLPVGSFDFDSTPLSGQQLGLRQQLPFPGLLGNRRKAAAADAVAAELSLADRRLVVDGAIEAAWSELGFAQRALRITDENIDLLRQLTSVTETKYQVGTGLQQDVLRAQVELTVLLEERLRREEAIDSSAARLAALLDLRTAALPETGGLVDRSPVPELDGLLEHLEERSPHLRALAAGVEAAKRRVRVAELEGYPDLDVGVGYRIRKSVQDDPVNGDDFFSAGFSVRLPVYRSKWRARAAESRSLLRRAQAAERRGSAELVARIRRAFAGLERADAETRLLETGLLPQAEQSLASSRSGYQVGRVDFPSLLDTQVRLLDARLRRVRALADRRIAFSVLEAAAGEKLR